MNVLTLSDPIDNSSFANKKIIIKNVINESERHLLLFSKRNRVWEAELLIYDQSSDDHKHELNIILNEIDGTWESVFVFELVLFKRQDCFRRIEFYRDA